MLCSRSLSKIEWEVPGRRLDAQSSPQREHMGPSFSRKGVEDAPRRPPSQGTQQVHWMGGDATHPLTLHCWRAPRLQQAELQEASAGHSQVFPKKMLLCWVLFSLHLDSSTQLKTKQNKQTKMCCILKNNSLAWSDCFQTLKYKLVSEALIHEDFFFS